MIFMKILKVKLAGRSYPVYVGSGAFDRALSDFAKLRASNRRVFCIADSAVLKAHPEAAKALRGVAEVIEISGGEKSKTLRTF